MTNGEINDGPKAGANPLEEGKGFADSSRALSWQLHIGSKKFPELECQSCLNRFSIFYAEHSTKLILIHIYVFCDI